MDLQQHLDRQREWSLATFGEGLRTRQITAHIRKECDEIESAVSPWHILAEGCDVIALAYDLLWRCGFTAEEISAELDRKLTVNINRQWPPIGKDDGQPIEHVREQ